MRIVRCPICGKPLMQANDETYIDFDIRKANMRVFCTNCKRRIRYSENPKENVEKDIKI